MLQDIPGAVPGHPGRGSAWSPSPVPGERARLIPGARSAFASRKMDGAPQGAAWPGPYGGVSCGACLSRPTATPASVVPRDGISALPRCHAQECQPGASSHCDGVGHRPARPIADRPPRHDRAPIEGGVDLYLDQQNIDTTTPTGRLLFQITGAFGEFERSMIRQRVRAGLNVIKDKLARDGKFVSKAGKVRRKLGRPGAEPDKIQRARGQGHRHRQGGSRGWPRRRHRPSPEA